MIELQLMSAEDRERFENRDRENLRKKAFSQSGRTATCTPEQAAAMAEVARLRARAGITAAGRVCRTSHSPADERQALHEKAKRYQAEHPGTDYLAAVKAVASDSPAAISEEQIERQAMHENAKRYQAEHPGTDYLAAIIASSRS